MRGRGQSRQSSPHRGLPCTYYMASWPSDHIHSVATRIHPPFLIIAFSCIPIRPLLHRLSHAHDARSLIEASSRLSTFLLPSFIDREGEDLNRYLHTCSCSTVERLGTRADGVAGPTDLIRSGMKCGPSSWLSRSSLKRIYRTDVVAPWIVTPTDGEPCFADS